MEITDLDRSNNLLGHVGFGVQWDGEDASICYAAGRNDKPYEYIKDLVINWRRKPSLIDPEGRIYSFGYLFICSARPKNLQLLEEYQPFVYLF